MKRAIQFVPLLVAAAFPFMAQAQAVNTIITNVLATLQLIITVLFVIATIVFLWGVIMYIMSAADPGARAKSVGIMTWGIIGLAVMAAAWGITVILINYFGVGAAPPIRVPPPA